MSKASKHRNPVVVELTDNVSFRTGISQEHHPALRSGFVGYPVNPHWNAGKYHAWKTGRQLRDAVAQGLMVVRQSDCLLVPSKEQDESTDDKPPSPLIGILHRLHFGAPQLA